VTRACGLVGSRLALYATGAAVRRRWSLRSRIAELAAMKRRYATEDSCVALPGGLVGEPQEDVPFVP